MQRFEGDGPGSDEIRSGATWQRGPSDPPRLDDGPGAEVEAVVAAPVATVWGLVTDIELPARYSPEFLGAEWDAPASGPGPDASFTGHNQHEAIGQWSVPCFVDRYEEERTFGWCTSDPRDPGARWWFDLAPSGDGTRLTYQLVLGPGPSGLTAAIAARPQKEARIIERRVEEHRVNMVEVVEGIRAEAEAEARPSV